MIKINSDGKILLALAAVLLALTLAGVFFDRDSRARMDEFTARIEAEAAAEAERRAAIDALLTEVRAEPRATLPTTPGASRHPLQGRGLNDGPI
ncbi:MAG: hypothetical protein LBK23_02905 [Oscillospiraceae bacterium]|jgi:hypothetical protein|nr:hypothetical protein [Oscillospiraceae bacterium]